MLPSLKTRLLMRLAVLLAALVVGLITGLGIWVFKRMIALAEQLAYGWHAPTWVEVQYPLLILFAPVLGGLLVGLILRAFRVPEDPSHGVTEVIEAAVQDLNEFPHRQVPLKASVAALSLGSGASLGPEDPAVEIGGGVGETVGRAWRLPHPEVRPLVAAGAAAGISAAFHAPLGALLFTVEVFSVKLFSRTALVVTVAVAAAFLLMLMLSPAPPLRLPPYELPLLWGLLLSLGLGLAAGAVAAVYIRFAYWLRYRFLHWRGPPHWLKPAIGGLLLGVTGLFLPQILGIGYGTVEAVVAGELSSLGLLLVLMVGKMVMMAVSFGSGFLGGFFAPSFFVGAMLGAFYGFGSNLLLPSAGVEAAAFAVVGMAALLAGAVHAPISAVLVVWAISGDYALLPFLLLACLKSYVVSKSLEPRSLYTYALKE